jgi:hypothetical protein
MGKQRCEGKRMLHSCKAAIKVLSNTKKNIVAVTVEKPSEHCLKEVIKVKTSVEGQMDGMCLVIYCS